MQKAKKRLFKKFIQKVAVAQKLGNKQEYYARRANNEISIILDNKYCNEFRPWWYEQDWALHQLSDEIAKFFKKSAAELESTIGVDIKLLNEFLKQFPKRVRRERKQREPIEQPIRKLRNPEEFQIAMYGKDKPKKEMVIGEKAFSIKGYDFFIHRSTGYGWAVSDVALGRMIYYSSRYKLAIKFAKQRIENNFDQYIRMVQEINQPEKG